MKIYIGRPPKPGSPERFTMGQSVARLTEKQVKELGFERPLRKFAKLVAKQGPACGSIGIEFHGLIFDFLLTPGDQKTT